MDSLTARLEDVLHRYAAAIDQGRGEASADEFRKSLRMLVVECGQSAIDAALGGLPDAASPSVSPH